jgi:hypothetical protein
VVKTPGSFELNFGKEVRAMRLERTGPPRRGGPTVGVFEAMLRQSSSLKAAERKEGRSLGQGFLGAKTLEGFFAGGEKRLSSNPLRPEGVGRTAHWKGGNAGVRTVRERREFLGGGSELAGLLQSL